MISDVLLEVALVSTTVLLASVVIYSVRKMAKALQQANQQILQQQNQIDQLQEKIEWISKGALGVGKRLMTAEKRLTQTMERQHEIENKDSEQMTFNQAAKLLEKGVELNDVVGKVGITRSEAKLVELFHSQNTGREAPQVTLAP